MRFAIPAALALAALLVLLGVRLDGLPALVQLDLFVALQLASLAGAGVGLLSVLGRAATPGRKLAFAAAALLAWRLSYFPIMVFSGHVASIGEWILALTGLPILVYPTFLISVAALHGVAAAGASCVLDPPHPLFRAGLVPAFLVALLVSFNQPRDLTLLPDTMTRLPGPVPEMRTDSENPYLTALTSSGYWPNQRLVLLAAGLTYATIPPSPWATTVEAVLVGLFAEQPHGATADRVLEHYLAYHSAHPRIGYRRLADCPDAP